MSEENKHDWLMGSVLAPLESGPLPIISKALWAEIQEWILAWKHAEALRAEGLDAPGALLLNDSIRIARRLRRREFLEVCERGGKQGA